MNVAQMIDTVRTGGAQKLLVTLAEGARGRDLRLEVLSLRRRDDSPIAQQLERLGVGVREFPIRRLADPAQFTEITRFLRGNRYDLLHTHLTYSNILGGLAGRLTGLPVVATLHNTRTGKRRGDAARQWLEAYVLRRWARRRLAVGYAVAEAHRQILGRASLEVIPNAVGVPARISAEERRAVRQELTGDPGRPILISLGRLTQQKAYGDLISAFSRVSEKHPSAALLIAGEGLLRPDLEAQIAALGLDSQVHLLGLRDDVPRLLAASDIFVSSSHWEGLPVAVLEAMAAGLAVVATAVGDVPRVVTPETGIIVPPKQPDRLTEAMVELLDDSARQRSLGHSARDHVRLNYSIGAWTDRLLAIYAEARRAGGDERGKLDG
jgi:glycosyltransferase involved in cell wall biosynthesis